MIWTKVLLIGILLTKTIDIIDHVLSLNKCWTMKKIKKKNKKKQKKIKQKILTKLGHHLLSLSPTVFRRKYESDFLSS